MAELGADRYESNIRGTNVDRANSRKKLLAEFQTTFFVMGLHGAHDRLRFPPVSKNFEILEGYGAIRTGGRSPSTSCGCHVHS
jgi:hypothetical protein